MSTFAAQYKKQDGTIFTSADGNTVGWKSASGAIPPLSISIADIGNLQQTPATAAKASIKLVVPDPAAQAGNYTFTFTSATARDDQQAMTAVLRKLIETVKQASNAPTPTPNTSETPKNGGSSAAMAMAQTVTAAGNGDETLDDAKLLADLELSKSLLDKNPMLRDRFYRALQDKPESVSLGQFQKQFWSTRVHMLRSHAIEKAQNEGTYNVLSVAKPQRNADTTLKVSMTKEQIHLIFAQHPIVKKAYADIVPPMSETEFWTRFFNSKLIKELKGERINHEKDPADPKLDKYLGMQDYGIIDDSQQLMDSMPLFINIEGNEQNHSQKQGNRPDITMDPSKYDKAPILRVLNRMSEKLMKNVPSSDTSRHGPAGLDEETYKELQLRDLQRADDDNRVVLQVQDQSRFFSAGQSVHTSTSAAAYTKRTPAQVLSIMSKDFSGINATTTAAKGVNLHATLGVDDESSSDEEDAKKVKTKVGSKSSRAAATSQIISAIRKRHLHDDDYTTAKTISLSEQAKKISVSDTILNNLTMTHNTTVEFLHYFWAVFHSGDPDRATEVAKLIETLDKSLDRIKAVADAAEAERTDQIDRYRRDVEAYNQRSNKKRKFDPENVKGGGKTVNQIIEPLVRAIGAAKDEYQRALHEQMRAAAPASVA